MRQTYHTLLQTLLFRSLDRLPSPLSALQVSSESPYQTHRGLLFLSLTGFPSSILQCFFRSCHGKLSKFCHLPLILNTSQHETNISSDFSVTYITTQPVISLPSTIIFSASRHNSSDLTRQCRISRSPPFDRHDPAATIKQTLPCAAYTYSNQSLLGANETSAVTDSAHVPTPRGVTAPNPVITTRRMALC